MAMDLASDPALLGGCEQALECSVLVFSPEGAEVRVEGAPGPMGQAGDRCPFLRRPCSTCSR